MNKDHIEQFFHRAKLLRLKFEVTPGGAIRSRANNNICPISAMANAANQTDFYRCHVNSPATDLGLDMVVANRIASASDSVRMNVDNIRERLLAL